MVKPTPHNKLPKKETLASKLEEAKTKPRVRLNFNDGRSEEGAITYFHEQQKGKIIDVNREFASDFLLKELKSIEF
jgi:hypothetical protein